jgi:hypothetical protein
VQRSTVVLLIIVGVVLLAGGLCVAMLSGLNY